MKIRQKGHKKRKTNKILSTQLFVANQIRVLSNSVCQKLGFSHAIFLDVKKKNLKLPCSQYFRYNGCS